MNKLLLASCALGLLGVASLANAAEVAGRVVTTDPASNTIVMEDGTVLQLPENQTVEGLAPGTEIIVTFDEQDGKNMVTDIKPAS